MKIYYLINDGKKKIYIPTHGIIKTRHDVCKLFGKEMSFDYTKSKKITPNDVIAEPHDDRIASGIISFIIGIIFCQFMYAVPSIIFYVLISYFSFKRYRKEVEMANRFNNETINLSQLK